MNITLTLNPDENILMSKIVAENETLTLNSTQFYNLATYLDLIKRYNNPKNIINNHENILQAYQYDSDDTNNYWAIIDKEYNFIDVGIPFTVDFENDKIYENLSFDEIKLIKSIKDYLN